MTGLVGHVRAGPRETGGLEVDVAPLRCLVVVRTGDVGFDCAGRVRAPSEAVHI